MIYEKKLRIYEEISIYDVNSELIKNFNFLALAHTYAKVNNIRLEQEQSQEQSLRTM